MGVSQTWRTALFWAGLALAALLLLWLLSGILLPFIVGMAAAYVLDPLADWLERHGLRPRPRPPCSSPSCSSPRCAVLVLVLLPVAIEQVVGLAAQLPGYFERAARPRPAAWSSGSSARTWSRAGRSRAWLGRFAQQVLSYAGTALSNVLQSSLVVLNLISLVFITPIVTFYLLRDWDRMVAAVRSVVPPRGRPVARRLAREIDQVLAGFLRGQGMVCLFLACFYGLGLDPGRPASTAPIIGLLTGLFSFIPYVGMLVGVAVGLTVAIFQFGACCPVGLVAAVFAVGQFIEGNFLTPRVVGARIRLHEVWVIFAVLAGTALFGLVGTFLATPVAAVIAVLVRFGVERWRRSDYFREDTSLPITRPPPGAMSRD